MEKYKFELAMLDGRVAFLDHDHLEKFAYLISRFFSDISLGQLSKEETKNINFAYVASSICDYDLVRYSTLEQLYGYLMIGDEKLFPDPNDAIMITLACGIHDNLIVSIDLDSLPDDDYSLIVENALIIKMNRDESAEIIQYLVKTAHNAIDNDLLWTFKDSQNGNDLYL
jgi:hypothetical protein